MPKLKVEISGAVPVLDKNGETYTVKVELHPGCAENVEYSIDGKKWQESNTFTKLKPKKYWFYARNVKQNAYVDSTERTLPEPPKNIPSVDQANVLINKMINDGNDDAAKQFKKGLGVSTPVRGVENISTIQELLNDIMMNDGKYSITEIEKDGHNIIYVRVVRK